MVTGSQSHGWSGPKISNQIRHVYLRHKPQLSGIPIYHHARALLIAGTFSHKLLVFKKKSPIATYKYDMWRTWWINPCMRPCNPYTCFIGTLYFRYVGKDGPLYPHALKSHNHTRYGQSVTFAPLFILNLIYQKELLGIACMSKSLIRTSPFCLISVGYHLELTHCYNILLRVSFLPK